ncbi:hypothetical protein FHS36_006591, partial [Streptomyces eurocidicus]|nr:hypothetical protein [Streptomyces eurocidicus]
MHLQPRRHILRNRIKKTTNLPQHTHPHTIRRPHKHRRPIPIPRPLHQR